MSRFLPQNLLQGLCMAAMVISVVLIALTVVGVHPDSMRFAGGIAVGLYAAAFCMWISDPESVVTGFPL